MQTTESYEIAVETTDEWRPGVPENRMPTPVGQAHWMQPDKQVPGLNVLKDATRQFGATFGTGPNPRGLSGVLRRAAYKIPDYEAKRWALLLFADRVDSLEDRLSSPSTWVGIAVAGTAIGLGAVMIMKRNRR